MEKQRDNSKPLSNKDGEDWHGIQATKLKSRCEILLVEAKKVLPNAILTKEI